MTPPALAMSKMDSGNGLRETEIDSGHFPKLLEFTPAECERLERRSAHPGPKKKKLSAAGWAKTESSLSCVGDPRLKGPRLKHLCVHVAGLFGEQKKQAKREHTQHVSLEARPLGCRWAKTESSLSCVGDPKQAKREHTQHVSLEARPLGCRCGRPKVFLLGPWSW